MTDQEQQAIARLRAGDIGGLDVLVQRHQARALRTAYALLGDRQRAEDVVADAFLLVYERIGQFDPDRPFTPWFYRIVTNGALKALRKPHRAPYGTEGDRPPAEQADPSPSPETRAVLAETRRRLLDTVMALPPKQRAVVVLRYYLDMDERTIADTVGSPLGTVKWRLHAARGRLRQVLDGADGHLWTAAAEGELA